MYDTIGSSSYMKEQMPKALELDGMKFGRLSVLHQSGKTAAGKILWACECDCGKIVQSVGSHILSGHTTSCGCKRDELTVERSTKHNCSRRGLHTRGHRAWSRMKNRTTNPHGKDAKYYIERGIGLSESWMEFKNFITDMGEPPEGMTLERVKNHLGYSKENCVWASRATQSRNRRNNIYCMVDGVEMCLKDACSKLGIKYTSAQYLVACDRFHLPTFRKD